MTQMKALTERTIDATVALVVCLMVTADVAKTIANGPVPDCMKWPGLAVYLGSSEAMLAAEFGMSRKQVREILRAAIESRPEAEQTHNPVGEVCELGPMTAEQANARIDAMQQTMVVEAPAPHEEEKRK